jgi:hypothetical protein
MFDFLTLSVVIDDRIFCVHGGALSPFFSVCQLGDGTDSLLRLIPIDTLNRPNQSRGPVSRLVGIIFHLPVFHFPPRGAAFPFSLLCARCCSVFHNFILVLRLQKFRTKALSPIWSGLTLTPRRRTLQFPRGKHHLFDQRWPRAIHSRPSLFLFAQSLNDRRLPVLPPRLTEAQVTRSGLAWSTNSSRRMGCRISSAPISSVWKATRPCLMVICRRCGQPQITVTDAETRPAFWR